MNQLDSTFYLYLVLLKLIEENNTDPLTGVLNRRGFEETLNYLKSISKRYERPLTLILVDMCDLKKTNNQLGHIKGDEKLKLLASTISENKREVDIVARVGGDEFAIILPETNKEKAKVAIERIQLKLKKYNINIKYGLAQTPCENLYEMADQHLNK